MLKQSACEMQSNTKECFMKNDKFTSRFDFIKFSDDEDGNCSNVPKHECDKEKNQDHVRKLQRDIDWIKYNLADKTSTLHQVYRSKKKNIILHWAYCLEELQVLGVYKKPIDSISNHMRKELVIMGLKNAVPYTYEILPTKYKHHAPNPKMNFYRYDGMGEDLEPTTNVLGNPKKYASAIAGCKSSDDSILLEAIASFKEYHMWWQKIAIQYEAHLKDPRIHKDFEDSLEWNNVSKLCLSLRALYGPMSILQQVLDEGNMRKSATLFQKAMCVMLESDSSFRYWAHKFGISPRQHQRIRMRLSDWPKKDAKTIIRNVLGSFCCPDCGFNLIERSKNKIKADIKNSAKSQNVAQNMEKSQNTISNPIEMAKSLWKGTLRPMQDLPC